jgi:hypothetical protein
VDRTYGGSNTDAALALDYTAAGSLVLGGVSYSPVVRGQNPTGAWRRGLLGAQATNGSGSATRYRAHQRTCQGLCGRPWCLPQWYQRRPRHCVEHRAITPSISVTASANLLRSGHVLQMCAGHYHRARSSLESVRRPVLLGARHYLVRATADTPARPTGAVYRYRWSMVAACRLCWCNSRPVRSRKSARICATTHLRFFAPAPYISDPLPQN